GGLLSTGYCRRATVDGLLSADLASDPRSLVQQEDEVVLRGSEIDDRRAHRRPALEPRGGEEERAAPGEVIDELLVEGVEALTRPARRPIAEVRDRQHGLSQQLEVVPPARLLAKEAREVDVVLDRRRVALPAVAHEAHPDLERLEAA